MPSAVYVGAGTDTFPVEAMDHINHFIFIDSRPNTQQPFSGNGMCQFELNYTNNVNAKMMKRGFYPVVPLRSQHKQFSPSPYCARYETDDGDRCVDYYFNTGFPMDIRKHDGLAKQIQDTDTIILAGHDPHRSLLELIKKPFTVCCFDGTYYGRERFDDSGVIVELYGGSAKDVREVRYYQKRVHVEYLSRIDEIKELE